MKHFFCLLTLIFIGEIYSPLKAQQWIWGRGSIGTQAMEGWDVATDDSGNVYLAGFDQSPSSIFGSDTITISGSSDAFLVKYDSSGNVLWAKTIGGSTSDYGFGVATDHFGHVYLTGDFQSPTLTIGSTTLTNTGGDDVFLAKFDSNGNAIWAKCSSTISSGSCSGYSVATDKNSNIFITGFFNATSITFGSVTLTGAGGTDAFIAKYDSTGNVLWAKTPAAPNFDRGMDVATDTMGNAFVAGHYCSGSIHFGTITVNNANPGADNAFLVKYDAAGNALWAKSSQAAGSNYGWGVATDLTGNSFIVGRYSYAPFIIFGPDTLFNSTSQNTEVFVVKYNASGSVVWARNGVGAGVEFAFGAATDSSGNLFVTGGYSSQANYSVTFGAFTLPFPNGADDPMYIVEYDKGGVVICATALPSGGDDNSGIAITSAGDIYVGGDFEVNPFILGPDTLFQTGYENAFLAKYIPCGITTTINDPNQNEEFNIYPNPSTGIFNLNFEKTNFISTKIQVYDIHGKLILQSNINTPTSTINLSGKSPGIYFYQITDENKILQTGKLIID